MPRLAALVALALAGLGAFGAASRGVERNLAPRVASSRIPDSREPADPLLLADELVPAVADTGRRSLPSTRRSAADSPGPEDPRWIDVAVRLPAGFPAGERPVVMAFSRRSRGELASGSMRRIAGAVQTGERPSDAVPPHVAWTMDSAADGAARVAVSAGAENAYVVLRSRRLHLAPVELDRATESLVLEPVLGGEVVGRCVLPRGARARGVEPRDVTLELADGKRARRRTDAGADGRFELWGLAPGVEHTLVARARGLPTWRGPVRVEAGERAALEVRFQSGAVVRGVVVDAAGAPVRGALVRAGVDGDPLGPSAWTDELGRYELAGIAAGRARLTARADARLARAVLVVRNGEVEEARSLELPRAGEAAPGETSWRPFSR